MSADFTHAILDWARSKPADEAYDYMDFRNCVICQFLKDTGRASNPEVDHAGWSDGPKDVDHPYDRRIDTAANGLHRGPETFGAFADRLAALVSA